MNYLVFMIVALLFLIWSELTTRTYTGDIVGLLGVLVWALFMEWLDKE